LLRRSKAAAGRAWIFHTFGGTEEAENRKETSGTVREEEQAQEQIPTKRKRRRHEEKAKEIVGAKQL